METSVAPAEAAREEQDQQRESRTDFRTRFEQVLTGRVCLRTHPQTQPKLLEGGPGGPPRSFA